MTEAQKKVFNRIRRGVSPALAYWVKGEFDAGSSIKQVGQHLQRAATTAFAELD
jgi:hypothetical protein